MRRIIFTWFLLISIFFLVSNTLNGGWGYGVTGASNYIWRGFDLNPDRQPVLQPFVAYGFGDSGVALELWGSVSFESREANEIDLTLSYTGKLAGCFFFQAGLIHYGWYFTEGFSFDRDTTQEVFLTVSCASCRIQPRFTVFYDFANGDGVYLQADMAYPFEISRDLSALLSLSAGYNGGQWLPAGAETGLSDVNLGLALVYRTGNWRISPFAMLTMTLLEALGEENYVWVGLKLEYAPGE